MLAGILMGSAHLLVEVILHVVPELYLPLLVTINTELSIGFQPFLVIVIELFITLSSLYALPLLLKQHMQIVQFSFEHTLIVYLWQAVQLLAQCLKLRFCCLIFDLWQLAEISILRMQGIDADTVIGIAILPSTCHIGIVDGQHLNKALLGSGSPVNHQFQVAKVAHTKASLTT